MLMDASKRKQLQPLPNCCIVCRGQSELPNRILRLPFAVATLQCFASQSVCVCVLHATQSQPSPLAIGCSMWQVYVASSIHAAFASQIGMSTCRTRRSLLQLISSSSCIPATCVIVSLRVLLLPIDKASIRYEDRGSGVSALAWAIDASRDHQRQFA